MLKSLVAKLLLVAVMCGAAACDDEVPTAPTPPANPVTETFTGSVAQNGAQLHSFTTASGGTVTATLKEVTPDSALVLGFSIGTLNGSACHFAVARPDATVGTVLSGSMSAAGTLCVYVHDVGNVPAASPAAYTVEVVHP